MLKKIKKICCFIIVLKYIFYYIKLELEITIIKKLSINIILKRKKILIKYRSLLS